jgi:hypothetical protein
MISLDSRRGNTSFNLGTLSLFLLIVLFVILFIAPKSEVFFAKQYDTVRKRCTEIHSTNTYGTMYFVHREVYTNRGMFTLEDEYLFGRLKPGETYLLHTVGKQLIEVDFTHDCSDT